MLVVAGSSDTIYGRDSELGQLARLLRRQEHNNILLVGKRGIGKSSVMAGLAQALLRQQFPGMPSLPCLAFDAAQLGRMLQDESKLPATLEYLALAFAHLPPAIVCIDDIEKITSVLSESWHFEQLFSLFFSNAQLRLVLALEEEQWEQFQERYQRFLKTFEVLRLKELSDADCQAVIASRAKRIAKNYKLQIAAEATQAVGEFGKQLPPVRAMPDRALRFFDEVAASCQLQKKKVLAREDVEQVFSQRQGIPAARLSAKSQTHLHDLADILSAQVIGQEAAVALVSGVLQRGWLGLKNPKRPIGSFLFLGPSGVGKTEMAKVVAREMYGSDSAFVRIDMSEYGEAHTVQRLLGAPPGYIGYEAGGQLTNPVLQQPFSLILLDEIEKAHPSVFDIFLQVLDDGRLTDGRGQTVDFSKTVIIATSNIGIRDIVAGWQKGADVTAPAFYERTILPLLQERFRLEFLNRFEGMTVFAPLSVAALEQVARLEIRKIEERFKHHNVRINLSPAWLQQTIAEHSDPRFGARPLKRALEQACESLIAQHLLQPN
jgi:ATP-dependent Clp protease ATP-binding subunit ClpC